MPLTKYNLYSPHHEGTLYFNHVTQEFITGPNLLEGRRGHASGTITDQETGERIVVIAGGKSSYFLDSTELLLDGEWHAGKNSHTVATLHSTERNRMWTEYEQKVNRK